MTEVRAAQLYWFQYEVQHGMGSCMHGSNSRQNAGGNESLQQTMPACVGKASM